MIILNYSVYSEKVIILRKVLVKEKSFAPIFSTILERN